MNVFIEISLIIIATLVISGILKILKQPLIIGYIFAGILIGPLFLNWISSGETIETFSHIGIALLLFTVGLNINPRILKTVGKVSIITGLGQIVFTSVFGYLIAVMLGFSMTTGIYIAIALTFSSTIIIMKLLSDKGELDTIYGRISIGFLLIQDLVVILVLILVPSIGGDLNAAQVILWVLVKAVILIGLAILMGIYVVPRFIKSVARSQEFLLLFSIAWCLALASLSYYLNLSIEIGALLAGVTLAMSPYRMEISSKMIPLRDFFIILFFILLGSQLSFSDVTQYIWPIIVFSLFILIGNPLIVMVIMGLLGYTKRNSFLAGLTVAQISEFSLIMVALGVTVGHLNNDILSMVTVVGLITITGSTYMILYGNNIYGVISKYLNVFERKRKKIDEQDYNKEAYHDTILFGYNRIGFNILKALREVNRKFMVVDYDPEVIKQLVEKKVDCKYGDVGDLELLEQLELEKLEIAISTIPSFSINSLLINRIRARNKQAVISVISHNIDDAFKLYQLGATYVLMPHFVGGFHLAKMIKNNNANLRKFFEEKEFHLQHLKLRRELGHDHPANEKM